MSLIHICAPPTRTDYTGKTEVCWCFSCRKRLVHRNSWLVSLPLKGDLGSPYDDMPMRLCVECGDDQTRFPGW